MSRIVVEPDEDAIAALVHDEAVQADLGDRLKRAEAVAKAAAPVDTGEYRSKIHVVEQPGLDGTRHMDADAEHSIYVEYGTRQTDRNGRRIHLPNHTLGNSLDATGGDHDV